jgi:hypothetical protein
MKFLKFLLIVVILAAGADSLAQQSSKSGTTVAQFLKIGVGPRAVGMGSAFAATADDISSVYWNPAGLSSNLSNEALFTKTNWIADVGVNFAAVASHLEGFGTIAVSFTSINSIDGMMVRTVEQPEGTGEQFDAGGFSIGLSYARPLTDNFSMGFNVKYIRENIWHESATGFAIDAGALYRIDVLNELRLGATISNFGSKMRMDGRDIQEIKQVGNSGTGNLINTKVILEEWDLPLLFRVGVAVDAVKMEDHRLTVEVNAVHPNDHTEYLNTGMEYSWNEIVFLRAGYASLFEENTEKGLSLGIGVNYRIVGSFKVLFDFAYQDFGRLESFTTWSIGVIF